MKNKHFFLTCVSVKGLKTPREGVHRSGIDCHREKGTANSPAFSQGIFGSDIQEFPENLDDLSTPGTGCCHLAGNYLPFRTVDWAAKKGVAVRDRPQSQGWRGRRKYMRDGGWVTAKKAWEADNEACERDTAVRADREGWSHWKHSPLFLIFGC